MLDTPDAINVSLLWPWWKLFWQGANVCPLSGTSQLGDFCAGLAEPDDGVFIDEFGDDDVTDFVELVEERVGRGGGGGRHDGGDSGLCWGNGSFEVNFR